MSEPANYFLASLDGKPELAASVQHAAAWLGQRIAGLASSRFHVDSRKVQAGDVFIALPGATLDGRAHIDEALSKGASAVLAEGVGYASTDSRVLAVDSLKSLAGFIANEALGKPSAQLLNIAITGTNGKTSISHWVAQALDRLGTTSAIVGTLGAGLAGQKLQSFGLTTPEAPQLHAMLAQFANEGAKACAFEASSIGLQEGRLNGLTIHCAVFTNLTQDHLDYHGSMFAYSQAKSRLFSVAGLRHAIINGDDSSAAEMIQAAGAAQVWLYGSVIDRLKLRYPSVGRFLAARVLAMRGNSQQVQVTLEVAGVKQVADMDLALVGDFNVSNALAVLGVLLSLGYSLDHSLKQLALLRGVPGRMQVIEFPADQTALPLTIVDYAHTPDALEKTLAALRSAAALRGGKLWCVFGAGGDRDPAKRPLMGAVGARFADQVVMTSDNPRSENPAQIIAAIREGVNASNAVSIDDRREAIAYALAHAGAKDVVLIAGKGHETTQEIAGKLLPFDDRQVAIEVVRRESMRESMNWPLERLFAAMSPVLWQGKLPPQGNVLGVSTDSRSVKAGEVFLAIRGETMDGHGFVAKALELGAIAAVIETPREQLGLTSASGSSFQVPSTMGALAQLAYAWRSQFALPVIAVAGSNGKTTVKEMIAAILRQAHGAQDSLSTQGNLNNEIGVPQTLFRLRSNHRSAVIEMGMNHMGEMARLSTMVKPTVAIVNNAQREHQEFLKSVEATARENGEVILALAQDGVAVFPVDDEHAVIWKAFAGNKTCITFGYAGVQSPTVSAEKDSRPEAFAMRIGDQQVSVKLNIAGAHNVRNALAAAACAHAIGISIDDIAKGLGQFVPAKGRLEQYSLENSAVLIDDTYNANPDSVLAAIEILKHREAAVLVLGDMGEVGDQGPQFHVEVGQAAAKAGISRLYTTGNLSELSKQAFEKEPSSASKLAQHSGDIDHIVQELTNYVRANKGCTVLVKGSRSMRMERVVNGLKNTINKEAAHAA